MTKYNYVVINDSIEDATNKIDAILTASKCSVERIEDLYINDLNIVSISSNDVDEIINNQNMSIEDKENRSPIETGRKYKAICDKKLYVSDSTHQLILYEEDGYESQEAIPTLAMHYDDNIELEYKDISGREIRMIKAMENEVETGKIREIESKEDLLKEYKISEEELKLILGTDWFMLYSENDKNITIHKMLKSPSSGILKKSVKEQREAIKMLMDKDKTISMEIENDRVYKAAKSMVRHMQKRYTMKVADEGNRIRVSEIQAR